MSLTEYALYERKWRNYPELAKLLDHKQLGVDWTGPTSVSDNIFDRITRILEIFALVQDNKIEIEEAIIHVGYPVREDLMNLSHALSQASELFSEASKLSSHLANSD